MRVRMKTKRSAATRDAALAPTPTTDVLTYSPARGVFIGINLDGAVIHQDADSTRAVYGSNVSFRQILTGRVPEPADTAAQRFIATSQEKAEVAAGQ
jgi:SH3 domain-containing YSC84-like protein 1